MTQAALEARLAAVEKQLAELSKRLALLEAPKDWRSTLGMFSGDEVMKQIDEEGRKIREADRRRGRKQPRTKPRKPAKQ